MRYLDLKLLVHMHFLLDSPSLAYFHENSVWICHVHALMVLLVCSLIISGTFYAWAKLDDWIFFCSIQGVCCVLMEIDVRLLFAMPCWTCMCVLFWFLENFWENSIGDDEDASCSHINPKTNCLAQKLVFSHVLHGTVGPWANQLISFQRPKRGRLDKWLPILLKCHFRFIIIPI